tara:strand:+ start:118 stop:339 length:222 start_codon:yes stop_codon:yes gene_type:complete
MDMLKDYNVRSNLRVYEHDLIPRHELVPFLKGAAREVRYRASNDRRELQSYWAGQADGLEKLADEIQSLLKEA